MIRFPGRGERGTVATSASPVLTAQKSQIRNPRAGIGDEPDTF